MQIQVCHACGKTVGPPKDITEADDSIILCDDPECRDAANPPEPTPPPAPVTARAVSKKK